VSDGIIDREIAFNGKNGAVGIALGLGVEPLSVLRSANNPNDSFHVSIKGRIKNHDDFHATLPSHRKWIPRFSKLLPLPSV
jgi:hypothetical protein